MSGFWSGRRVLVTGGAGFVGSHLVRGLVEVGARVRVADNLSRGHRENLEGMLGRAEFIQCDLTQFSDGLRACDGCSVVFHLASKVGGIRYYLTRPAEVLLHNTLLDNIMAQVALSAGAERIIYASSAHVYPKELQSSPHSPPIQEDHAIPANPELSYGWGKLVGEKLIEYVIAEGRSLRAAILRLIGVYGENQDSDLDTGSVIPVFIRRAIEYPRRKPFIILGTGEETRSYCYVQDVVDAMLQAAEALDAHVLLGPLNVGSEERVAIRDLANEIIRLSGKEIVPVYDKTHQTVVWGQALDCARARSILRGWRPKVDLKEGLSRTYEHALRTYSTAGA